MRILRAHFEAQFPRSCPNCGTRFGNLAEYLRITRHVGEPVSFDDIHGEPPAEPVGTLSLANCTCGTTLSLGTKGLPNETVIALMIWARGEVTRKGIPLGSLLSELRAELDREVLSEH